MQTTKYWCDRCQDEISEAQHNKPWLTIQETTNGMLEEPAYCNKCEKEIEQCIKHKPNKNNTNKKNH